MYSSTAFNYRCIIDVIPLSCSVLQSLERSSAGLTMLPGPYHIRKKTEPKFYKFQQGSFDINRVFPIKEIDIF